MMFIDGYDCENNGTYWQISKLTTSMSYQENIKKKLFKTSGYLFIYLNKTTRFVYFCFRKLLQNSLKNSDPKVIGYIYYQEHFEESRASYHYKAQGVGKTENQIIIFYWQKYKYNFSEISLYLQKKKRNRHFVFWREAEEFKKQNSHSIRQWYLIKCLKNPKVMYINGYYVKRIKTIHFLSILHFLQSFLYLLEKMIGSVVYLTFYFWSGLFGFTFRKGESQSWRFVLG